MIRQLGLPNFFITLSSAETIWINLIKILKKNASGINISDDEAIAMSSSEKTELIKNDPVTCARYFDHKIRALMKLFKHKMGFSVNILLKIIIGVSKCNSMDLFIYMEFFG